MKKYVLIPLCALLALSAPTCAEDLTTLDGVVYEDISVTGSDDAGINILHKSGGARLHFEQLPPEYKKRYNYDPGKVWFQNQKWASKVAAISSRPILIVFLERDTDKDSQVLWEEVLDSKQFNRYAQKKIVRLLIDFPETTPMPKEIRAQNHELKEEYEVEEMPYALLIDSDGAVISQIELKLAKKADGDMSAENLGDTIDLAIASHKAEQEAKAKKLEEAKKKAAASSSSTTTGPAAVPDTSSTASTNSSP